MLLVTLNNLQPQCPLLRGVEQEFSVDVALFPDSAKEGIPRDDAGRGPDGKSLSLPPSVKLSLNGSRGSVA